MLGEPEPGRDRTHVASPVYITARFWHFKHVNRVRPGNDVINCRADVTSARLLNCRPKSNHEKFTFRTTTTSESYTVNKHYGDVIMGGIASQITSLTIVYSTIYSDTDQRKHQSSASLAFVWGIHRSPVNSPHKGPVTRKMFPFDDVIMWTQLRCKYCLNFDGIVWAGIIIVWHSIV